MGKIPFFGKLKLTVPYFACLARYPDGRLLVGGYFTSFRGHPTNHLAWVLADGSADATFTAPFSPASSSVSALALQPNGWVLLSTYLPPGGLLRLLPDGGFTSPSAATSPRCSCSPTRAY